MNSVYRAFHQPREPHQDMLEKRRWRAPHFLFPFLRVGPSVTLLFEVDVVFQRGACSLVSDSASFFSLVALWGGSGTLVCAFWIYEGLVFQNPAIRQHFYRLFLNDNLVPYSLDPHKNQPPYFGEVHDMIVETGICRQSSVMVDEKGTG